MNTTELISKYKGEIVLHQRNLHSTAKMIIARDKHLPYILSKRGEEYVPESFYKELTLKMNDYVSQRTFFPNYVHDDETLRRFGKLYYTNFEAIRTYLDSPTHRFLYKLFTEEWTEDSLFEFLTKYAKDRMDGKFNVPNAPVGHFYDLQWSVTAINVQEADVNNYSCFNLHNMLTHIAMDSTDDLYHKMLQEHLEISRTILIIHENIKMLEKRETK